MCGFYVQGAIQAKLLSLAKVKGTVNCANFLTKHPKSGTEVRVALPSLGMYEEKEEGEMLSEAQRINVKVGKVGTKHKWKPPVPARPDETNLRGVVAGIAAQDPKHVSCKVSTIKAAVFLGQIRAVAAQDNVTDYVMKYVVFLIFLFFASYGLAAFCCRLYEIIRGWWARVREPRLQWIEMPQEEERDADENPGMFGVGSPMRRPRYIPLQQVYTSSRGHRVHRSRECSSLSEVPPEEILTHYMCSLCNEEPTVIQLRRQAVAAAAAKGAAKAAAAKPAPKVKAFPRSQGERRDSDESGRNRPPSGADVASRPPTESLSLPREEATLPEPTPEAEVQSEGEHSESSHHTLPSDARYDSDENPYNNDDGVRYISDQFLEDLRQEAEEERRRARYLREELGEVSDPELWMELHHHDYDSSESESGPETTEPQDSSGPGGTLTASTNPPYVVRADPPEGERAAPPSGEPRQLSESQSEASDRGS